MPIIKSISDLRNDAKNISRICHETGEPIFITKGGEGDLVVMSQALFERQQAMRELYYKLEEAENDAKKGDRGITHAKLMKKFRERI